jgi:septal ring factor EnvC (AmiA/AmiB activator)
MKKTKTVSTNELARLIKKGFDGVDERFNAVDQRFDSVDTRLKAMDKRFDGIDTQLKTVNNRLDHLEAGVADLRTEMKTGFAGIPSRKEFEDFRQLTEKRERAFAAKLGLDLAKIDAEG